MIAAGSSDILTFPATDKKCEKIARLKSGTGSLATACTAMLLVADIFRPLRGTESLRRFSALKGRKTLIKTIT